MTPLFIASFLLLAAYVDACPDGCTCKLKSVACPSVDYQGLVAVVANLSSDTTSLLIGGPVSNASVPSIKSDTFENITAKGLTSLTFYSAGVKTIEDGAFRPLKNLKFLTLKHNPLESVPGNITADNEALTKLSITFCRNLGMIDKLSGGEKLNQLDLSNNNISRIEDGAFSGFSKLTNLSLAYNNFDEIGQGIFTGINKNLLYLDLSQSTPPRKVQPKPFKLFGEQPLKKLKFAGIGNKFFNNGTIFTGLTKLTSLDISNNSLTDIPFSSMGAFAPGLTELIFNDNNVTKLMPEQFKQLPKLKRLSFEGNGLQEIKSDAFKGNKVLENISLKGNKLPSIPDKSFTGLSKLKSLDLSGCGLRVLSNFTIDSTSLQDLNLAGSILQHLNPGPFQTLVNLKKLDLSFSSIRTIAPGTFDNLEKLKWLDLHMNLLETISDDMLQMFQDRKVSVQMAQNLWDCSCEAIEKTKEWLEKSNFTTSMICNKPENVRGQDVEKVSKDHFCYAPNITNCCHIDLKAELGSNITFFCNASGSPKPDIVYDVTSGHPLPVDRTIYSTDRTQVTVFNVDNTTAGTFTCFASNRYGNITTSYEMYVLAPEPTLGPSEPYKKGTITWIIIGVIIAIIFIATIIGLTVYFVKKRNRQPTDLLVNSMETSVEG